ncbi:AAA family ATPase [Methyloversatilis discipulorum]|uniref:AAA family ATPase n=1 Tax=Methyloversatilis discipulorum TaxID=1119528 RepID=UPI001A6281FC|nr:AAA family ATPase [Methyloversatilis discipulorum]MBL8467846.1 AAA family ATPase [Methyloversatilis discipulorum]
MKISRLRVDQFRRFRQPFELRDLDPGLNLFAGPNEAGKSTLVAALRAAFFERHRSGTVEHLRPWGDASAAPEVELDFELDGTPCRLTKRFLGKKRCTLQFGTHTYDGAEAEDFIAEQLGFAFAAKGSSKAEHWGIPGLLWMEQGSAQDIRAAVTHATDHLRTALNASLGEIAGGDGDDVTNEVERLRNELLTPSSDRPRGAYAEALQAEQSLREALAKVDVDLLTFRQKVDQLAQLRREHDADAAQRPWEDLRARAAAAAATLREAQSLQERLHVEKRSAQSLQERADLLRQQLDRWAEEASDAQARAEAVSAAQRALDDATALAAPWQQRERDAQTQHDAARRTLALTRARDNRLALVRELDELRRKSEALAATLAQAEAEQARQLALQAEVAACEIRADDLNALRGQARQLRELDIRRTAIATRLRFALDAGRELRIGNDVLSGDGERLLLDATTLTLPGFGRLRIEPGGGDLAALAREAAELRDRHAGALARLGLASLDAAETRQQQHAHKLSDLKAAQATLKALAPQGVDALRAERAALAGRAAELTQRLTAQADEGDDTLPPIAEAEAAEDAARHALADATRRLADARNRCVATQAALDAAQRELGAARARLDDPARAQQLADTRVALTDALAQHEAAVLRIADLARQLDAARPQALAQDVERYTRSAEQIERSFAQRRDALTVLEVELQAAGAQGLDERRAGLARDHAAAERRAGQLARRARALDLLLRCLRDKRHALTQRLQAPLQTHLNHYLGLLFPGARIALDDSLSPGPLTRDGTAGSESGEVDELSFGAREQMGVIARLAYADLLKEAGKPTLIILDDALVHSDDARLERMKRVLFDAALRHQVLLFTCHPDKWRDMGVPVRTLEAAL